MLTELLYSTGEPERIMTPLKFWYLYQAIQENFKKQPTENLKPFDKQL